MTEQQALEYDEGPSCRARELQVRQEARPSSTPLATGTRRAADDGAGSLDALFRKGYGDRDRLSHRRPVLTDPGAPSIDNQPGKSPSATPAGAS